MPKQLKIFIIEDDPDQVLMYTVAFEGRGFEVFSSTDGDVGIRQVQDVQPDAVLLDIHMEGKSGLDVLRELKQRDSTKHIPVVIFTNFSKRDFEKPARKLGADAFIVKTDRLPREIVSDVMNLISAILDT